MLEEGFKKQYEEMNGEIQQLKYTIRNMKRNSGSILGFPKAICVPVLLVVALVKSFI